VDDDDPEELTARCSDRRLSPVVVLMDPLDDAAVTAELLAAHDPGRGVVVVHPTPATSGAKALGQDLLHALGRPISRLATERVSGATPAWHAATAWIAAGDVDRLIVLRAHRLTPSTWEQLLELWRCTGVRLVLVCHDHKVPRDAARLLEAADHYVTQDFDDVLPTGVRLPPRVIPADPPAQDLPPLPDTDFIRFRADAYRRLAGEEFIRVDMVYGRGLAAACTWLARHRDTQAAQRVAGGHFLRGIFPGFMRPEEITAGIDLLERHYDKRTLRSLAGGLLCVGRDWETRSYPSHWGDVAGLQLFLTELVADSPSRRHTIARLRGAQAGFLLHGLLLTLPEHLPSTANGPSLTSVPVTAATAARIRAGVAHPVHAAALATALFTGLEPTSLAPCPISALSQDCAALDLYGPVAGYQDSRLPGRLFVPEPARPLLRAARTFLQLRGTEASKRLLTAGIGVDGSQLAASAVSCQLALPATTHTAGDTWHTAAQAWWVGRPLHPPERAHP
jgi:hypothetical protein